MKLQKSKLASLSLGAILALLLGITGCSNSSGSGTATSALPQPSVNCGGESCID